MIEGRGIGDTASGIVRNDCDVIPNLVLIRITDERIEGSAHRDIGRPRSARVIAVRIEQLRVGVVGNRVARVKPYSIQTPIGRHRKRPEPVPLTRKAVVVDPVRCAEG